MITETKLPFNLFYYIALVKAPFSIQKCWYLSYFSRKTYVEVLIISAWLTWYPLLSRPMQALPCFGLIQQTTILWYFFYFFSRKQDLKFHANCLQLQEMSNHSSADNLHEMSTPIFWEAKICTKCQMLFFSGKNISMCRLLKILPRVLSVKQKSLNWVVYKANFMHSDLNF